MTTQPDPELDFTAVLGAPREFTSGQVSERVGIPTYRARRYWRALGFANVPDGDREFTNADIDALALLLGLVRDGVLSETQALELARSFGRAVGRLATSQAESLIESPAATAASGPERSLVVDRQLPDLERLLIYAWRRHLAVAMQRLLPHVSMPGPAKLAVGFADLVGFTEMSRRLSERELADFVRRFESAISDFIIGLGGRVIKSLGDEVLFVAEAPAAAANIALAVAERARRQAVPGIRIGLEFGSVVAHAGDVFGDTVNLASRLTTMAEPNHVLLGPALAEALSHYAAFRLVALDPVAVRGFGMTTPSELHRSA